VVPPAVREAANWLTRHPDSLAGDEQARLQAISRRCQELQAASNLVRAFAAMITDSSGHDLAQWIAAAGLPGIASFAKGLELTGPCAWFALLHARLAVLRGRLLCCGSRVLSPCIRVPGAARRLVSSDHQSPG